jgi:hypothetical protein
LIVANTAAMKAAIDLADRLDANAIPAMLNALLGGVHPEWAGKVRRRTRRHRRRARAGRAAGGELQGDGG